jgi:hypothetical protein
MAYGVDAMNIMWVREMTFNSSRIFTALLMCAITATTDGTTGLRWILLWGAVCIGAVWRLWARRIEEDKEKVIYSPKAAPAHEAVVGAPPQSHWEQTHFERLPIPKTPMSAHH